MKSFKNFNEAVKGQDTESRKEGAKEPVSYTHLTLPTTPYV